MNEIECLISGAEAPHKSEEYEFRRIRKRIGNGGGASMEGKDVSI